MVLMGGCATLKAPPWARPGLKMLRSCVRMERQADRLGPACGNGAGPSVREPEPTPLALVGRSAEDLRAGMERSYTKPEPTLIVLIEDGEVLRVEPERDRGVWEPEPTPVVLRRMVRSCVRNRSGTGATGNRSCGGWV